MFFASSQFSIIVASSSSDPTFALVFLGLIILAIGAFVCYNKGWNAGEASGNEQTTRILQEEKRKFEKTRDEFLEEKQRLIPHLRAISTFRRTIEWAKAWWSNSDVKRLEEYKDEAAHIINSIYKDLEANEYKQSLNALEILLQSKKRELEGLLQWRKLKFEEWLSNETSNAKSKMHIAALQTAREELLIDIDKLVQSIIASHPDNAYVAISLGLVKDAAIERLTESIESEYGWKASVTATRAIADIRKKFNENARQWHHDAVYYKCQTALYESLFPQLMEYSTIGESSNGDALSNETKTTERDWLSDEEYAKLSSREKSQLALDRYVKSPKSKWQVGRDYELFVGYKFRCDGWRVEQFGVEKKLEDMGRDLICRKTVPDRTGRFSTDLFGDIVQILVVQCKFWSSEKIIHEKHIAQLFGTTVEYAMHLGWPYIDKEGHLTECIKPVFVTSASLSETAKRFAEALSVEIKEGWTFNPAAPESFPRIKCNLGKEGEKIYHLPFDQQYDVTRIDSANVDECWSFTVDEAENNGYRRAMRWLGD